MQQGAVILGILEKMYRFFLYTGGINLSIKKKFLILSCSFPIRNPTQLFKSLHHNRQPLYLIGAMFKIIAVLELFIPVYCNIKVIFFMGIVCAANYVRVRYHDLLILERGAFLCVIGDSMFLSIYRLQVYLHTVSTFVNNTTIKINLKGSD